MAISCMALCPGVVCCADFLFDYIDLQDLADVAYLLSPQDLMALQQLPDMIAAGVGCFKIEGRLKGPEYVAATTAAYRAGEAVISSTVGVIVFAGS